MEEETLTLKPQLPTDGDEPMLDMAQQNPQTDSGSGSDSDDDEAQDNLQLQTLETELSTNPSNYDSHVQYINLLRKMGDIEKLRRAREAMSDLFPLIPVMWQEWARDESSLITGTEAFPAIEKLYERGVSDYLSASLWSDYLDFIQEYDASVRECSPAGISKARDLFERALTATGLHISEGSKIWEAYREFEQAIVHAINESDIQAKEKQIQRVRSIFHRQLSVPHLNMRSTLLAYKVWEVEQGSMADIQSGDLDGVSSHVASAYQKALDVYNARVNLEEKISTQDKADTERFQEYMNYLKFEQSSGNPARVQVLYERAITDFPVSSDLWLDYTRYLDKTFKVGSIISKVYSRAIKNCPWVGQLWVRYLLYLERSRAPEKEIAAVFEKALQCTFSTLDEYLDLFLTRVDGLRRRILLGSEVEDVVDYSLVRKTFQHASHYLSPHLKNTDAFLRLHSYWARLELTLGKDLVAARGVWETFLKICGPMLEAWEGYTAMEKELGHIKEARSIYKRCYSKRFPGTGSEDICHAWLRFEREFGTLEDLDHAAQKVTSRLEELQLLRSREESKLAERESISEKNTREKRKKTADTTHEQSPAKRHKDAVQNLNKVHAKGKTQVPISVENHKMEETKAEVEEACGKKEEQSKDSNQEKARIYTDQCTAFVSNLNLKANLEDLTKFFSDGGVVGIRILRDKFTGKSRGLAYVDFLDDAHLTAAISKNKEILLGKKLSIARSEPRRGKRDLSDRNLPRRLARGTERTDAAGDSASRDSVDSSQQSGPPHAPQSIARKPRVEHIQLKGKNTFAVPRNVAALNLNSKKPETQDKDEEQPKSNDEFRKMLTKG
ncbi:uncharacterized protein LOC133800931 isoform X1 [Humulus lupulus]|uniref:uncharacterized protein LOC133800931 isoform X1 n=1 Tax=Humulus lupulus TaxID=3486 RepID=UPI002B4125FB|nr:uncharacterized protein LOC133800931 isoform X1 [Humulus lupulus]